MTVPDPVWGDRFSGSPVISAQQSNFSRQVITSLNLASTEVTVIPTAGVSVGNRQYVNFTSVSQWGNPGQWSTNFSAVAVSDANGETWQVPAASIRLSWFNTVPGGIYAPYIHPWSSGRDLYFTLSLWSTYSVMLMRTTLAASPS